MTDSIHPVRQWRKDHGKTLGQLAEAVGVTASHLSEVERGRNELSLDLARKIKRVTGLSLDSIVQEPAQ